MGTICDMTDVTSMSHNDVILSAAVAASAFNPIQFWSWDHSLMKWQIYQNKDFKYESNPVFEICGSSVYFTF